MSLLEGAPPVKTTPRFCPDLWVLNVHWQGTRNHRRPEAALGRTRGAGSDAGAATAYDRNCEAPIEGVKTHAEP
jgi:hypothetical protein